MNRLSPLPFVTTGIASLGWLTLWLKPSLITEWWYWAGFALLVVAAFAPGIAGRLRRHRPGQRYTGNNPIQFRQPWLKGDLNGQNRD
jgi:hypothetical protein